MRAAGTIAAGHVDAIANAARNLDDAAKSELAGMADDLVAVAEWMPVADFERDLPLAEEDPISAQQRGARIVDVRRFRSDAVQLQDPERAGAKGVD